MNRFNEQFSSLYSFEFPSKNTFIFSYQYTPKKFPPLGVRYFYPVFFFRKPFLKDFYPSCTFVPRLMIFWAQQFMWDFLPRLCPTKYEGFFPRTIILWGEGRDDYFIV
jgi:hypothetical protein